MSQVLEVMMMLSFGSAWPFSIAKSYRSRTAKGKSPVFLIILMVGYVFGILAKITADNLNYVVFFYALNLCLVSTDLLLYVRNRRLDQAQAERFKPHP